MSCLLQFINTLPFYKTHSLSEERMGELLDPSNTEVDAAVAEAFSFLRDTFAACPKRPYIGTSGGKDSGVIDWLASQVAPMPRIHNLKVETHPDTLALLSRSPDIHMVSPASHAALVDTLGVGLQVDGTRRAEFNRTNGRSTDVIIDGESVSREHMPRYIANGLFGLSFAFPILDWSDEMVWACTIRNRIQFSYEYVKACECTDAFMKAD